MVDADSDNGGHLLSAPEDAGDAGEALQRLRQQNAVLQSRLQASSQIAEENELLKQEVERLTGELVTPALSKPAPAPTRAPPCLLDAQAGQGVSMPACLLAQVAGAGDVSAGAPDAEAGAPDAEAFEELQRVRSPGRDPASLPAPLPPPACPVLSVPLRAPAGQPAPGRQH